eukprot:snap_masked-scaffold213_size254208-processed-gene-1.8 protein:Tk11728 transcript:snap_masked-scaffold213_size254208-processed-gene-1.8-mRNA-1 annotation:"conserved hypothetical protein"
MWPRLVGENQRVSWAHKPVDQDGLDLLTIGNSTYTLEPRIVSHLQHPANWGLKISEIRPEDAGTYICQISTFPPKVRIIFLEIQGEEARTCSTLPGWVLFSSSDYT